MGELQIRPVERMDACRALEALQAQVWGDPAMVVPAHQLYVVARHGGVLLAAYEGEQPVGFVYGFPARHGGRWVLHSHMLGVLPVYRDRGVGRRLKEAQREYARALGYPTITWTFDPLECRNAYLNLRRLRARARTYLPDFYGSMQDALNRDLPSDRLLAEWDTEPAASSVPADASPEASLAGAADQDQDLVAFAVDVRADGWPVPGAVRLRPPGADEPSPRGCECPCRPGSRT
ncbi:GNAT family N-acetyltransferase [Thermaerobacter sp. FW80]|uniref:GNAT family N-acetyltransferase n=1 Tax=Thermaerobacter sp. FW80 TaxID=2546351 RepID=UPI001430692F|nr:GNAT family N-acetyltransferase [Thermaerobacter sp. FW80]